MRRPVLILLILLPFVLNGSNYYWVGGSGNWSDINHWATTSGGNLKHITVPSPADDVWFDHNSFLSIQDTVLLPPGIATCRDFDWSGINTNPVLLSKPSTTLRIYGSMYLKRGMKMPNCPILFEATSPGHILFSDSIALNNSVTFDGPGGAWSLADILYGNSLDINLLNGNLNAQGFPISARNISSPNPTPRTLSIQGIAVKISGNLNLNSDGLIIQTTQDTIFMSGGSASFTVYGTGNPVFNDVIFTGNLSYLTCSNAIFRDITFEGTADISGNIHFRILDMQDSGHLSNMLYGNAVLLTADMEYELENNTILTIIDSIHTMANCFTYIDIFSEAGATISKTSGFLNIDYVTLYNIHAQGGASFSASNSLDLGGNPGWTISPPPLATHYWVGGTGSWNDSLHWSYSSGGPPGACIPTPADDVIFDQASFTANDTVILDDALQLCHDMIWQAVTDTPCILSGSGKGLYIYGSLTFQAQMDVSLQGGVSFNATQTGKTITTANHFIESDVIFNGQGGAWTLQDSLQVTKDIHFKEGNLNTNDQGIVCKSWLSNWNTPRTLNLGASTVDLMNSGSSAWSFSTPNLSILAGTSHIRVNGASASFRALGGVPQNYHNITFTNDTATGLLELKAGQMHRLTFMGDGFMVSSGYQFDSLVFSAAKVYEFEHGSTCNIIQALVAPGSCDGPILMRSDTAGYSASFHKNGANVNCDNLVLRDIHATGTASFTAFNSSDLGNNSGWNFILAQAQDLYWIGGSGAWSDTSHWSYSSGGPGGACVPRPTDNVFFDMNSNDSVCSVNIDLKEAHCHNMTWDLLTDTIIFIGIAPRSVHIHGSLAFDSLTRNEAIVPFYFESKQPGNTIRSERVVFNRDIRFEGKGGGWTLLDTLETAPSFGIIHEKGSLSTGGETVLAGLYKSNRNSIRGLDIRNSDIFLNAYWLLRGDSLTMDADSSHIILKGSGGWMKNTSGSMEYYFLTAEGDASLFNDSANVSFSRVRLEGDGFIRGTHTYDTLIISKGYNYMLATNDTQFVDVMEAEGDCFKTISLRSDGAGTSYIHKVSDTLDASGLIIQDVHGIGGAYFRAIESVTNGNTTGWHIISSPPRDLYWVNGTGSWSEPQHWSASSGGPGGECIPRIIDNVFFDILSFNVPLDTVRIDVNLAECHNMTWIALNDTPRFEGPGLSDLHIAGSLLLNPQMYQQFLGKVYFIADSQSVTINSNGHGFLNDLIFEGTGSWTLLHDLLSPQSYIRLQKGNLNTNGWELRAAQFESFTSQPRNLQMGNSLFYLKSLWRVNTNNLSLNAGNSQIILSANSAIMINSGNNALQLASLEFSAENGTAQLRASTLIPSYRSVVFRSNATLLGQHVCDTLVFSPGMEYKLEKDLVQKVNTLLQARGNNCQPITLRSTLLGTQAKIRKDTGIVSADFLHIRDILCFGGASFYAGVNSTDVSNNGGWIFANNPGYIYGLGNDTTLTLGDTVTVSTVNFNGGPGTTYLWSTGSTGSTLDITYPGTYYITVTYAGNCSVVDSITVGCLVNLNFLSKAATCFGGSDGSLLAIPIDTGATYTYTWSTGDTIPWIFNLQAGDYWVYVLGSNGCIGRDTGSVGEAPEIILPLPDTAYCRGDSLLVDAGPGFSQYSWSVPDTTPSIWIGWPGTYYASVIDSVGCISDTFFFNVREDTLPVFDLGMDTTICLGEILFLRATDGYDEYTWQNGQNGNILLAQFSGIYWVDVRNGTCTDRDSIRLNDCPPVLHFPNVFTPNADGYNDDFGPDAENIHDYELLIFNRWGGLVFRSNSVREAWDGRYHNEACTDGVYFYVVRYREYGSLGKPGISEQRGTVTLLR